MTTDIVFYSDGSLWGMAGGQLEYVGQRIEMRQRDDGRWFPYMVLIFTDHDVRAWPMPDKLVDGEFYEIEVPICQD